MKALTDKIIERLEGLAKTCYSGLEFGEGLIQAARIIEQYEKEAEFEEVARVMMKHMGIRTDLYHPHYTVITTNSTCELVEGQKSVGQIMDYISD